MQEESKQTAIASCDAIELIDTLHDETQHQCRRMYASNKQHVLRSIVNIYDIVYLHVCCQSHLTQVTDG